MTNIFGEYADGSCDFITQGFKVTSSSLGFFVDDEKVADYDPERGVFVVGEKRFVAMCGEPSEYRLSREKKPRRIGGKPCLSFL